MLRYEREGVSPVAAPITELIKSILAVPKVAIACLILIFLLICSIFVASALAVTAFCKYRRLSKRDRERFIQDMVLMKKDLNTYKEIKLHENNHQEVDDDPPLLHTLTILPRMKHKEKERSNGGIATK